MSNPSPLGRFTAVLAAIIAVSAIPLKAQEGPLFDLDAIAQSFPEAVISEAPDLPSQAGIVAKSLLVPSWAFYDLARPDLAAGSAALDFLLVAAILDFSKFSERDPSHRFAGGLRGMAILALVGHHALSAVAGSVLQARYEQRGGPKQIKTGQGKGFEVFFPVGQYQSSIGIGGGYSFEYLRLTFAVGAGLEQPAWGLPDTGYKWDRGEELGLDPVLSFGIEGRWRMNPLLRLHPGVHILSGSLVRTAWVSGSDSDVVRKSQGLWIIPSLAVGFDPSPLLAVTLGLGWEAVRPGMAADFQKQVEAHGHRIPILPRLRMGAQAGLIF